ncbi:MAG: hypothetical protein II836_09945 [Clostridia bacterium]|nr:hypothetical protein [Clostridia bacterium]
MTGKQKCAILKEIRRDIAAKNDIAIRIEECTHKGECRGTCPRCESEVKILERALAEKKKRGIKTAVAGISAGLLAASLASCVPVSGEQFAGSGPKTGSHALTGDIAPETLEAERTEGEIAIEDPNTDPDDGTCEALEGDVLAGDYEDLEPLMGEPPVTDYEVEEDPDAEVEYAGVPLIEDYEEDLVPFCDEFIDANGDLAAVEGMMVAPDWTEEAAP